MNKFFLVESLFHGYVYDYGLWGRLDKNMFSDNYLVVQSYLYQGLFLRGFSLSIFMLFVVLLSLFFSGSASWAAVSKNELRELQRQRDNIILQQEERLRQLDRDFYGDPSAPGLTAPELLPKMETPGNAPCMEVRSINTSGVTLLSSSQVERLIAPYLNQCLSTADINNLLRDITNAYINQGYITTRAFVDSASSQQSAGVLSILVIEGTVENIILNNGHKNFFYRGKTAFPGLIGKSLNLRDIEQGLDQLNRMPSADATMELEPGESLGSTVIKVNNAVKRSWRLGFGFDNNGQLSTGEGLYSLSLEKDNLMGIGDQFAVYWSQDAPFWTDWRGKSRLGHNRAISGYMSLPFGYWTLSGNISHSSYNTKVFGLNNVYRSSGNTDYTSLRLERVIHRDQDSKTSAALSYAHRAVDSFFEGLLLQSSYKLTTFEGSLAHSRRLWGGSLSTNLGITKGVDTWATRAPNHFDETPQSKFTKYTASLSWYRPFEIAAKRLYWSLSAFGQMTPETLYGAERIQIGGRYSVRGFKNDSLSGDQGGYISNEFGWNLPWFNSLHDKGPVWGLQFYGAYDWGALYRDSRDPFERGRMQGATIGMRTLGDFSCDFSVSKALEHPSFIKTKDAEWYLSVKYTF